VIRGLDISISEGEVLGLLGANGAGKSTLLKLLLGLLAPDSGRAFVAGERADQLSAQTRARIGYVPQVLAQFSWLTGRALLTYLSGFYPQFDRDYARTLIQRWDISLDTPIETLSPGQQQRLSIVRALATRPDLIVLDEPIASLDPAIRIAVIEELKRLRQERPMTLLFSSHIVSDLQRLCGELAIMAHGKMVIRGPVSQFADLMRLTIEGEEALLAGFNFTHCFNVRKPSDEQRVVLISASRVEAWIAALPDTFALRSWDRGLDVIVAEWMQ
jgi:ABC-2 type transport system ATP-binding protein